MKKLFTYAIAVAAITVVMTGCKKESRQNTNTNVAKIASDGFMFSTANTVKLNISLKAPNNDPLSGVIVKFYNPQDTALANALFTAVTDGSGNISAVASIPSYLSTLVINPGYLGLPGSLTANINGNSVTATVGGATGYSGDIVPPVLSLAKTKSQAGTLRLNDISGSTDFKYPSPYTSANAIINTSSIPFIAGRPVYIATVPDVIDALTLSYVNSSLPEGRPVPTYHPQYLSGNVVNTINVLNTTDVSVTFLTGITSNNNTLAYYTYPTNNPPASVNDIKNATFVFPNSANRYGLAQLLQPGDKVKLGTFNAGTTIAFVMIVNGWTQTGVDISRGKWYSKDAFNTDGKRHSIQVYDDIHKSYYIGFEDAPGGGDNDYNDLVFTTTASDPTAISNIGVVGVDRGLDTDGDGVPDVLDAFPNDPAKAYISYFPSQNTFAQIAFEDNWPKKGDYDLNDLVVNYRYTFVSNARNQVVTLQGDYSVAAAGANYKSGFGVQLPVSSAAVQSVTGQRAISNYIQLASNGVESGQAKAVIIPFDNFNALINNTDGSSIINTLLSKDKVTSGTASVLVAFNTPVDQLTLNATTLNPFLISNLHRGNEIHLPGYAATDKADRTLFGTFDDASIAKGVNYIGTDNGPWAINYNTTFSYPVETVNISAAYPHFLEWATSGGTLFRDWYINLGTGYRDNTKIYNK